MKRGDVFWADMGPESGTRPVLIVTRSAAIAVRSRVTVAPVTTRIRAIGTEVPLGRDEGLSRASVAACDDLATIPKMVIDPRRVGSLGPQRLVELDAALRFALGI